MQRCEDSTLDWLQIPERPRISYFIFALGIQNPLPYTIIRIITFIYFWMYSRYIVAYHKGLWMYLKIFHSIMIIAIFVRPSDGLAFI